MLQHPWIRKDGVAGSNVIEPEVIRRLKAFANMNAFKKHTLTVRLWCGWRYLCYLCGAGQWLV